MASFSPLDNGATSKTVTTIPRQRGRGHREPSGIVIDRTCRVYISKIPTAAIERDGVKALRSDFEAFGPVESYKMFTERSGRFIGSALCTFRNPADATAAVAAMNDREVDDSVLKVTLARDHGVVLLHQKTNRSFIRGPTSSERGVGGGDGGDGTDGGENDINSKWKHDKYELLAQGKQIEEVLGFADNNRDGMRGGRGFAGRGGFGMGGRGGGGFGGRGNYNRVEEEFERYIADRDKDLHGYGASSGDANAQSGSRDNGDYEADTAAPE